MDAILKEVKMNGEKFTDRNVDTIFIGGGTPSLLEETCITDLLENIKHEFYVEADAEVSIETNPGTLTKEKLAAYGDAAINRISIGVQSLSDNILDVIGRLHSAEEAEKCYELTREAGFQNINLDTMFALPGQDMTVWRDTVEKVIKMRPEHISFYSMQLEENSKFYNRYKYNCMEIPDDKLERGMHHAAIEMLESAGYIHYEISNATLLGYECRHNLKYWSMQEYLGMGLGAHSYIEDAEETENDIVRLGVRCNNTNDLNEYIKNVNENNLPVDLKSVKKDTVSDAMSIYIFTALRTKRCIDFADFRNKFGKDFYQVYNCEVNALKNEIKAGLIECGKNFFHLTEKGIDRSNDIMAEFV